MTSKRDADPLSSAPGEAEELHPYPDAGPLRLDGLTLVSWNVAKPRSDEALDQLLHLASERDPALVALQESTHRLRIPEHMGAHFVRSHLQTGVATAARVSPLEVEGCASPSRELRVATRKMALVTRYPVADGRALLLVNVHALNFDRGGQRFLAQLQDLARRVQGHSGPVLFAGDFNTWSTRRLEILTGIVEGLGLREALPLEGQGRTGHAGRVLNRVAGVDDSLHLDRVFVRDLQVEEALWLDEYDASDHTPLLVRLRDGLTA